MTDNEMRVAIGRVQGLEITADSKWAWCSHEFVKSWKTSVGDEPERFHGPLPDYLHDLNAMHEAEARFMEGNNAYWINLLEITDRVGRCMDWRQFGHATARQRAEAFLRTVGKWRGE